ncbi:BTB/POZ domain-containing protein [Ditylenchus destructor]|nr:BTB/POZ domain-containing protein [Ditylenchus destructor]
MAYFMRSYTNFVTVFLSNTPSEQSSAQNCRVNLTTPTTEEHSSSACVWTNILSELWVSQTNSATNSNLVRLDVGGKTFETTKDTLSRYPESILARMVNGELSSDKDESGTYLISGDPEYFETILTYLHRGVLKLDGKEWNTKALLCEAEFYKIQPLVDEIRKALRPVRLEVVVVRMKSGNFFGKMFRAIGQCFGQNVSYIGCLEMSEQSEDNEVLQALRQKVEIRTVNENGFYKHYLTNDYTWTWITIESTLHRIGFVNDNLPDDICNVTCVPPFMFCMDQFRAIVRHRRKNIVVGREVYVINGNVCRLFPTPILCADDLRRPATGKDNAQWRGSREAYATGKSGFSIFGDS